MMIKLPGYRNEKKKHFVNIDRLNDDSTVIDVGACEADVIKALRSYNQTAKCKIFAMECNMKLIKYLREQNLFNVELCEKALVGENVEGDVMFFEGRRGANWGSIKPALLSERWKDARMSYTVKTLKINDIFDEFDIDIIDYMKMDIEGSEKMIFDTMSVETAGKIKQLSVEIHWPNPHAGITMEWAEQRLIEFGFKIKIKDRAEIFCERNG